MPGNDPSRSGKVVTFRTYSIDLQIVSPTVGALEDFEREFKKLLRRAANNQALQRRHDVTVKPPGSFIKEGYKDEHFQVFASSVPGSRRITR